MVLKDYTAALTRWGAKTGAGRVAKIEAFFAAEALHQSGILPDLFSVCFTAKAATG